MIPARLRAFMLFALIIAVITLNTHPAVAQTIDSLTVDQVVALSKSGLSDELIIAKVRQSGKVFDLTVDDLLKLKQAHVSDAVVKAMMNAAPAPLAPPPPAASAAANLSGFDLSAYPGIIEPGVYMKKGMEWVEVLPEVVNWKTGGVLKTFATAGIVKGDVNGNVEGPSSRNAVKTPLECVIYAPEGVAITEYQLLRLRVDHEYREFRTVTGGVMHAKGGATRDLVPFEHKKLAPRFYQVVFPGSIATGEYGFLPPGAFGSANGASMGKIYSFKIIE